MNEQLQFNKHRRMWQVTTPFQNCQVLVALIINITVCSQRTHNYSHRYLGGTETLKKFQLRQILSKSQNVAQFSSYLSVHIILKETNLLELFFEFLEKVSEAVDMGGLVHLCDRIGHAA